MELASATTPAAGHVGAVLVLEPGDMDLRALRVALEERIRGVPRLRQCLRSTPLGCGRPIWVDHPSFDIARHVDEVVCPTPADRASMLKVAAGLVTRELPRERPVWSATLVTGLANGTSALVIVFHHVMADGMGGLAALVNLVDGALLHATPEFPHSEPNVTAIFADAMRSRLRAIARPGSMIKRMRAAASELGGRPPRAPRCSLNAPVGPHRCLAVAKTELGPIHASARAHGVTVNDAVLAAITGALRQFLADRAETVDHFVISIPVSTRAETTAAELGNQIGVMAVSLPGSGNPGERMEAIGAAIRSRKQKARGASASLLAPASRLLAATGTLRWFTDHQHRVNVFVTNLRGPDAKVQLLGQAVEDLVPINSTSGNVRVAFGVFSYDDALTVTVVADASLCDELAELTDDLQIELDAVAATNRRR